MATPLVPMVLDGTKTQTRRVGARWLKVKSGDVLAMREAFSRNEGNLLGGGVLYRADNPVFMTFDGWTPAVHMPLDLVRVYLHVTRVWQERADDISDADAVAEGMEGVTVEDLLEMAGGSKRLCINVFEGTHKKRRMSQWYTRELWNHLAQDHWPAMTARERFLLVLQVLGGLHFDVVTAMEFEAVRV